MITLRDFQNSWHIALVPLNTILNYRWILKKYLNLALVGCSKIIWINKLMARSKRVF